MIHQALEKYERKKKKNPHNGVKIPKKFKELVEKIEQLSVLDLAELVKILDKKIWGSRRQKGIEIGLKFSSGFTWFVF